MIETAMRHLQAGAWQNAMAAASTALSATPADPDALLLCGLAIAAMGDADRAAPILRRIAALRPDARHPCLDLADLRPPLPSALVTRQFEACLRQDEADLPLRLAFADYLLEDDRAAAALAILQNAPPRAAVHHLRGLAQADLGAFAGATASFRHAVARDPAAAASWSNLGMMLKMQHRFDEALAAHDTAVSLAPNNARLRVNRAVTQLTAGDWTSAWQDYEGRFDVAGSMAIDRARMLPALRPGDGLAGTTVLALHEEGFGDTLQFSRYLPLLAERGARVIACVPPALARLIQRLPGVAAVTSDAQALPPHDFVCPMFSLPRVFGTTVRSIPPAVPARPDQLEVLQWDRQLPDHGLRVGLVWAGQARPSAPGFRVLDRRRSAGLAALAPLASVPGVCWISLQAGPPARQATSTAMPIGMALSDPMPAVRDFADTAAIVQNLDVVVSVDTAVVHLAGMLGKPVFLLDRFDGCWRWLTGRRDSPWYPDLTIFRQPAPNDWATPVAQAAEALAALAMFRGTNLPPPTEMRERRARVA